MKGTYQVKKTREDELRERAEQDLEFFIRLVHPDRMLGHVHQDLIKWWGKQGAKSHQLVLLPRDHGKSAMLAYRVAWAITRDPATRVLYVSATSKLAVKQLGFIKNILTCDAYRRYWPDMINENINDRLKWTETEISVDHPIRKRENIRDATIDTAGLTTTITGLHFDIICLDDVVIDDNSRDKTQRDEVKERMSYMASIAGTDSELWVVGTRYHPDDYYGACLEQNYTLYDDEGMGENEYLYEVFERQVEDKGDGTGNFLWPRMQRYDGKWFGFDMKVLAKKKAQYFDLGKYRAQYYNNPNSESSSALKQDLFQYYDKKHLTQSTGHWYFKERRLNVFAAIDLAYSTRKDADFTCIVVGGIDHLNNIYVLDIERFKTGNVNEYFDKILKLYTKWGFRKIRTEIIAAQMAVVKALKDDYIRPHGLALSIDEQAVSKKMSKEDRIESVLYPKYHNLQVWHFRGGNCELLEEELTNDRPKHDDIKDALACAVEVMVPPSALGAKNLQRTNNIIYNARFGGIA